MTKPTISEGTRLLFAHAKQFEELKQQAIEESSEFIVWMYGQAERRLMPILGPTMVTHRTKDSILFRLPEWRSGNVEFGISYAMTSDPIRRLMTRHSRPPWVGIGTLLPDDSEPRKAECLPITDRLAPALRAAWREPKDFEETDYAWPLCRYVPVSDGDFDRWATTVVELMAELAQTLAPVLSEATSTPFGEQ